MIYAISDIHGYYDKLYQCLDEMESGITFDKGENKLIFLGDYIDGGPDSQKTLELIHSMQLQLGAENIIVLRGNHEDWFLDFLDGEGNDWLGEDVNLRTSKTFLTKEQLCHVKEMAEEKNIQRIYSYVRKCIIENHKELITWMKKLPYFYETDKQIFVHAGVDEEAGDWWNYGTPEYVFTGKYPATIGKFYKDIIAGHVAATCAAGDQDFEGIFFDGDSHYYIDGSVEYTGNILCLAYDENKGKYYELELGEKLQVKNGKVCGNLRPF